MRPDQTPRPPHDARLTDHELVARARGGDAGAFGALFHRHQAFCHAIAVRTIGDRDLAADAVQEGFLHWLGRLDRFELAAEAGLRSYLYPVIRHTAIRLRERRDRTRASGDAAADADAAIRQWAAAPPADLDETARVLRDALARLPEGDREVVILRVVDGLSTIETARALDLPSGTIKSRLARGLRTLRSDPTLKGEDELRDFDDQA